MSKAEAISTITACTPVLASCAVFAIRRAKKGIKAIDDDNKAYGLMNLDIAAGQTLKGIRAANEIALSSKSGISSASVFPSLSEGVKSTSELGNFVKSSKVLKGIGTVIDKTAQNINPLIVAAGGVKVLTAEDKIDAFDREALGLGCMFASEAIAKKVLGMPKIKKDAMGKFITIPQESILHNTAVRSQINKLFGESQLAAINDFAATKMIMEKVPANALKGGIKGALFVTASILGYQFGEWIANKLLGKEKPKKSNQTVAAK